MSLHGRTDCRVLNMLEDVCDITGISLFMQAADANRLLWASLDILVLASLCVLLAKWGPRGGEIEVPVLSVCH